MPISAKLFFGGGLKGGGGTQRISSMEGKKQDKPITRGAYSTTTTFGEPD